MFYISSVKFTYQKADYLIASVLFRDWFFSSYFLISHSYYIKPIFNIALVSAILLNSLMCSHSLWIILDFLNRQSYNLQVTTTLFLPFQFLHFYFSLIALARHSSAMLNRRHNFYINENAFKVLVTSRMILL